MGHIIFASHGSYGDLYPFLAIGAELQRRGHRVTLATHANYAGKVAEHGLAFAPMAPSRPEDPAFHARFMHRRHGAEFAYRHYLDPAIEHSYADLMEAATGADVLVSVTLALAAPLVAATLPIRWLSCAFQPSMLYSATDPPRLPPLPLIRKSWAAAWNARLYTLAEKGIGHWIPSLTRLRATLGLPPGAHPAFRGQHSPQGVLALFSPLLGAPQPDWPANSHQTGAIIPPDPQPLLPELAAFLNQYPAPLIFTLGSASANVARDFFTTSATVANRIGGPALFLLGTETNRAYLPPVLPANWLAVDYAPYGKAFAHARAIIHQGGMGTGCFALLAGKPQLLVPFAHDQHDNARRISQLGVGRLLPAERYNASRASRAISALLTQARYGDAAGLVQPIIAAENGVVNAANAIESHLARGPLSAAGQAPAHRL